MIRGGNLADILGKEGLCELGFDIPRGKVMARQATVLNRVEEKLPPICTTYSSKKLQKTQQEALRISLNNWRANFLL